MTRAATIFGRGNEGGASTKTYDGIRMDVLSAGDEPVRSLTGQQVRIVRSAVLAATVCREHIAQPSDLIPARPFPAECQRHRDAALIKPVEYVIVTNQTATLSSRVSVGGENLA